MLLLNQWMQRTARPHTWCRLASVLAAATTVVVGCSARDGSIDADGPIDSRSDAITKGKPDTTHTAVMLQSCNTPCICSGTLIHKDDSSGVGWIATAAHCVPDLGKDPVPRFFVQGDTAATFTADLVSTITPGAVRYPVLDWVRHPDYKPASGNTPPSADIALVRVLGVGPETPILPLAGTIDGMAVNLPAIEVGYGSSGKVNDPKDLGVAGTRQRADVKIKSLDAKVISFDGNSADGSVNLGDDGGPTIASVGGVETVVAVHSARVSVVGGARQDNTRITGVRAWIDSELAMPPKLANCNSCLRIVTSGAHTCSPANLSCLDNADCNAFALCVESCAVDVDLGPTKACRDSCAAAHPNAVPLYEAAASCGCQTCAVLCGSTCDDLLPRPEPADGGDAVPDSGPASDPPDVTGPPPDSGCSVGRPNRASDVTSALALAAVALAWRRRRSLSA